MSRTGYKTIGIVVALCVAVAVAAALTLTVRAEELGEVEIGEAMPDFTLVDHDGEEHTLSEYEGKIVVLDFRCHQCPWVRGADPDYNETVKKYEEHGVVFLGIDPHEYVTTEEVQEYNEGAEVVRPVLRDDGHEYADKVGATRTPEVYIVDNRDPDDAMKLVYHGAVDDRNAPEGEYENNWVAKALDNLLADEEVENPRVSAWGCTIKR